MKLTWNGHACFTLESQGYAIVVDPYKAGEVPGLSELKVKANEVFCSHGHDDHNAEEVVEKISAGVSPFTVKTVQALGVPVVIPMHYRGETFGYDKIGEVTPFLEKMENVQVFEDNTIEISAPVMPLMAVLTYKG